MSLLPRGFSDFYYPTPMHRVMARTFNDMMNGFERSLQSVEPYWLDQPSLHECNIGNAVGEVINNAERFQVDIDVSQFHPEELSVNLKDDQLVVEGHHEERSDENGRIERHFIRKYIVPNDVNPECIESHLSDRGVLSVSAKKMALEDKNTRRIPIQAAPHNQKTETDETTKDVKTELKNKM